MTWAYPVTLWGLVAVPLLIISSVLVGRKARRSLRGIGRDSIEWLVRSFLRDIAISAFFIFAILAASDPRIGRKPITGESSGLDVAVAFDVSRSMLAPDISPSRLDRSVTALQQITRTLDDSRFSLVPFKGEAILMVPMTEDRVVLDLWTGRLGPGLLTHPGTDLETALSKAGDSFPGGDGRNRALVLITDGEALSGRIDAISRELAERAIPVYVLAAGTIEGSTIPLGDGSYVKDSTGHPVVSRTDLDTLKDLAEETGGTFHELFRPGATADLIASIKGYRDFSESRGIRFIGVNRYRIFLIPSLSFLLFFLLVRIVPWRRN